MPRPDQMAKINEAKALAAERVANAGPRATLVDLPSDVSPIGIGFVGDDYTPRMLWRDSKGELFSSDLAGGDVDLIGLRAWMVHTRIPGGAR